MLVLPRMDNHHSWVDARKDPRAVGEAVEALTGFEGMLTKDWRGWAEGVPLARDFFVSLQHQAAEGVKFWRMVRTLDGVSGLAEVVHSGLANKMWKEYTAAAMALEFGSRIRAAGGDAEFIQRDHDKSPDARLRLVDRWITVEFKGLHERDEMEAWYDFEQTVMNGLTPHGLAGVAFDRELTPAALGDPGAVVEGLLSIAVRNVREYELLPRGTGRARLAPINCGKCGYPVEQTDELVRLTSRVRSRKWYEQLERAGGPTLLIVRANTLFGTGEPGVVGAAARRVADALNVYLPRLRMISAVLVYDEPFWAPRFAIHHEADDLRVRIDTAPSGCARFMTLVRNADATEPLHEADLDKLVGPQPIW